jgi:hypothetical protein
MRRSSHANLQRSAGNPNDLRRLEVTLRDFLQFSLLLRPQRFVQNEIFGRAQRARRRQFVQNRNGVIEVEPRLPFERLKNPESVPFFERGSICGEISVKPFAAANALRVNVDRRSI